ncbi:MAG: hypothetical protein GYB31_05605 [Bacteroidetes bacterium]|nr:hypothetical protein [Bacteroidota bacterium]
MAYKEKSGYYMILAICMVGVVLIMTSCGGWQEINFKAGRHGRFSATPQVHNWRVFEAKFTDQSKYVHGTVDQWDWNKLRGFYSLQVCNPVAYDDCGMIGWRYLPDTNMFQITPYTHYQCGEKPTYMDGINVLVDKPFTVQIVADTAWRYWIDTGDSLYTFTHPRTKHARVFKQMNGWFGGSTPTPHAVGFYVRDLKEKEWGR